MNSLDLFEVVCIHFFDYRSIRDSDFLEDSKIDMKIKNEKKARIFNSIIGCYC